MKILTGGPTLRDFVIQAQVRQQYREFLRLARRMDGQARHELVRDIRAAFRVAGAETVGTRLAEGTRQLHLLKQYCGHSRDISDQNQPEERVVGEGWPWARADAGEMRSPTIIPRLHGDSSDR